MTINLCPFKMLLHQILQIPPSTTPHNYHPMTTRGNADIFKQKDFVLSNPHQNVVGNKWVFCIKRAAAYCVFVRNNLVLWSSKKQQVVARLSTESEYCALSYTSDDIIWVQQLLGELGIS
ncbi:putative mitochondrial protein [Cucumis melo var. makuwa]|uniref:Mitochondrial protein n=1 Tax=Cucumis melo var. makuwa TaxID=1194695 RepID=A0A5D3DNK2_CUCMM|nr:putative mitochondrial protein [Cucumis melo var. makuwa]TYK24889.1 putative mitochondrial protein [Cucumis melo var. makuwa]